ncbi:hypothetical protein GBA52_010831 [Prunus armeniaca]|nr:hypothetical protein GBA52_010831 [Prunus armeniaca]
MASPSGYFKLLTTLLFASLLLSFLSSSPSPANASTPLVESVCSQVPGNRYCKPFLDSDPRTQSATNLLDLAKIVLDLTIALAEDCLAFVDLLIKNLPYKQTLDICGASYKVAVASLKTARGEVEQDAAKANTDIQNADFEISNCGLEMSINGTSFRDLSLIKRTRNASLFCNIGVAITSKL